MWVSEQAVERQERKRGGCRRAHGGGNGVERRRPLAGEQNRITLAQNRTECQNSMVNGDAALMSTEGVHMS